MVLPRGLLVVAVVLLVVGCGDDTDEPVGAPTPGAAIADGEPDCGGSDPWVAAGAIDLDVAGATTAEEALRPFLRQWQDVFGGEVVMVGDGVGALSVDGLEVVVADAVEVNGGGFAVSGSTGCDGYGPEVLPGQPPGGPATVPFVTSTG